MLKKITIFDGENAQNDIKGHPVPVQCNGRRGRRSSNGGLQFLLEFDAWCQELRIEHTISSSNFPQSNGKVEKSVVGIKKLRAKLALQGNISFEDAVNRLRATQVLCKGLSLQQLFFQGPIRQPSCLWFWTMLSRRIWW